MNCDTFQQSWDVLNIQAWTLLNEKHVLEIVEPNQLIYVTNLHVGCEVESSGVARSWKKITKLGNVNQQNLCHMYHSCYSFNFQVMICDSITHTTAWFSLLLKIFWKFILFFMKSHFYCFMNYISIFSPTLPLISK